MSHIVPNLPRYMDDYENWLKEHERKLRTERRASDMIWDANLGGSPHYQLIMDHIRALPHGSWASSFVTHVHLEASEQVQEFYKGEKSLIKKVPDQIRLEISADSGAQVLVSPLTAADKQIRRRKWCDPNGPN